MSYYDRLQKVIGEEEGGTDRVQQAIDLAKEKSQADFQSTQSKEQAILPAEINKFGEEFGIKMGAKLLLKKGVAPLVKRSIASGREALDARASTAQDTIESLGKEAGGIFERAGVRMATGQSVREAVPTTTEGTGITATTGDAGMFGTNAGRVTNDMTIGARTAPAQTQEVGRRLPEDAEGEYGTADSGGLTASETARLAGIDTETGLAADTIATAGAKTAGEVALDAVPVVGEIAMMAGMFGGMIHSAVKAHREQMADETTERTDLQNVQAAQMYSGFNRPNFGTMALPSFDTSKNPQMLQE